MKSKYSPLVKFKESEVEKLENHLHGLNTLIDNQQDLIDHSKEQILKIKRPQDGNFKAFVDAQDIMIVQKIDQNMKIARKVELEEEKVYILDKIKEANIELEKIKYLHNQEIQIKQKELKRLEDNEMNEISIILHNNRSA